MANHLCVTGTIRAQALFHEGHQTGPYTEVTYSLLIQHPESCDNFKVVVLVAASVVEFGLAKSSNV